MTIFISYLVSTRESRISRGLIRDSRVDTWVRYENCHIVIFLSYILIHDHFFPFFVLFIYFILFYFILFYFILFYFILFYLFIYFDIPPKRAAHIENSSRHDKILLPVTLNHNPNKS